MKRFLSLTLIAIMLFSTLTLTSCVLPKGLYGGFIDIIHHAVAGILGEYEIDEAQWENTMSQTNYSVIWNVSHNASNDAEYFPWLEYYIVKQTDNLRYEQFLSEENIGNQLSTLYAKNGDVYYKYIQAVGDEVIFEGELAHTLNYYCLGYITQSPVRTLAQEVFLEGVKFEDLEFDDTGRYHYKTTLFGKEIEYIFEFRFGSLYEIDAGWFNVRPISDKQIDDYSSKSDIVDKKLD